MNDRWILLQLAFDYREWHAGKDWLIESVNQLFREQICFSALWNNLSTTLSVSNQIIY